jgi:hypothetical protein
MKKYLIFSTAALAAAFIGGYAFYFDEHWPSHNVTDFYRSAGEKGQEVYLKNKIDASRRIQKYTSDGDYLNYSKTTFHRPSDRLKLDDDGFPMVKHGEDFFYSPVTVLEYALAAYDRDPDKFIPTCEKILRMQGTDGAFRYPYVYRHYLMNTDFEPGWVSGMAQGQALSVYARAYARTKDPKWLAAGNSALRFLQVKMPDGPMTDLSTLDPSLSNYIFFAEYPTNPPVYTLNGYMFVLLGLYDWWKIAGSDEAGRLFSSGMDTLESILPYYDIETFSTYDLGYITHALPKSQDGKQPEQVKPHVNASYHAIHIAQLMALYSVTDEEALKEYADRWLSYISADDKAATN